MHDAHPRLAARRSRTPVLKFPRLSHGEGENPIAASARASISPPRIDVTPIPGRQLATRHAALHNFGLDKTHSAETG